MTNGDASRNVEAMVIDIAIRLGSLGLFAWLSLQSIGPFVMIAAWAVILTIAIYPVYAWLKARIGDRGGLAAVLITVVGFLIILGPAAALLVNLAESAQTVAGGIRDGTLRIPLPPDGVREWPLVGGRIHEFLTLAATDLGALLSGYKSVIIDTGGAFLVKIAGLGGGVLTLAAAVLLSGVLYRPGPALADGARKFAKRIVAGWGERFVNLAGATIRNVSRGVIGVSLIQALLAGIVLLAAGVPGAGAIALAVLILGIVQVGPGIVLIPTIIWVWMSMDTLTALVFTVVMASVTLMDNVLKPIVMGRGLDTPMLVIFIGVLGGAFAHGLVGLFLGPIVLAVFYDLVGAWMSPQSKAVED